VVAGLWQISILKRRKEDGKTTMAANNNRQDRRQTAVEFLQLVVSGRIDAAYEKYVDMQGKHHNVYFAAGLPALKRAMIENHAQFPNKQLTVKNVIGDGNLVAVHSRLVFAAGEKEMVVVHLFRFSGDRIVEMWDCGQRVPEDMPNRDGAF
jgi:predicted SnoaL-like aldol condensation-catalyzing enzyme